VVAAASQNIFVEGIYPIEQAARLARLSSRSMRRWFNGEGERDAALVRRMPENEVDTISFVDLIQSLAVRAIRHRDEHEVSLQKIRQAINTAASIGIDYPFARKHKTFLFRDDIVIEIGDRLVQITGKYKRQHLIRPVVELYLDDLTFDPTSGLASEYVPLRDACDDRRIVINPLVKYGSPVVMPVGYTVGSLTAAVDSEGSIEAAADMFQVVEADVKFALRYEDILAGTAQ
jgi:uncharacterized protein (DUF433 family)